MGITIQQLSRKIDTAGLRSDPNKAEVKLEQAKIGNLGWGENMAAKAALGSDAEVKRTAGNAQKLINNDFGGDEAKGMAFLKELEGRKVGNADFNTMAENGDLSALAKMKAKDPAAYERISNSDPSEVHSKIQAYNEAKNKPAVVVAKKDPAPTAAPQTAPRQAEPKVNTTAGSSAPSPTRPAPTEPVVVAHAPETQAPKTAETPAPAKPAEPVVVARAPEPTPAPKTAEIPAPKPEEPATPDVTAKGPETPAPTGGNTGATPPIFGDRPPENTKVAIPNDFPYGGSNPLANVLGTLQKAAGTVAETVGVNPNQFQEDFADFKERLAEVVQKSPVTSMATDGFKQMGAMADQLGLKPDIVNYDTSGLLKTPPINPNAPMAVVASPGSTGPG